MHELLAQLFGYARGMWRYRWLALVVAWAIAIAGWTIVSRIPDEYRSSARVFVDTNSVLRPLLRGLTIQPDLVQRVALMSRMLLSRPNLEKIIRMSDLDLKLRTEAERERLISDLSNKIKIRGDRSNPSLYTISFEHRDPQSAKLVVQSLVSIFIEEALVSDQRATSNAQDFLDQEIEEYEARLRDSEHRLADFKRRYAGLLSGDIGGYYANLQSAQKELKDAELTLQEAKRRRDQLQQQIETQEQALESAEELAPQLPDDPRIAALQTKLDELLLRYTERHPDVIELRRLIREIRARQQQRSEIAGSSLMATTVQADSLYGSLRMALSQADAQVAALQARVDDHGQRVRDLDQKIDTIPEIEAELTQLTRNYKTIVAQHAELLERRESARLSSEVEKTAEGVKFRVIDPPVAPLKPSAPNRLLLASGVLLVALGGGLLAALAMDLVRPVFDDRRLLYRATGLPVLGTVALVRSPIERRRERIMLIPFFAMTAGLAVAFIFVVSGLPLLQSLI
ncbi:XrtA system polysaccharide chain length determinant [Marichromatium gracile]|uniref:Chain length-determining protein n=1 Tax=Marichromatium gracile TaxID=1048 RepID=A0ABR5VD05_MARGR|nr:XrtA system polysaccharide chain length determinant [Marichromatium gracile]KXX63352.1 chain length-determining protein [Marichromatium gracile]